MNKQTNWNILDSEQVDISDLPENIQKTITEEIQKNPEIKINFNTFFSKNLASWDTENAGKFVFFFPENWRKLCVEFGLSGLESNVLLLIIEKMHFGNLVQISQSGIAKELNTKQPSVSRVFKSLKNKQVLFEDENKNIYLNPRLCSKGSPHSLNEKNKEFFIKAYSFEQQNFENVLKKRTDKKKK